MATCLRKGEKRKKRKKRCLTQTKQLPFPCRIGGKQKGKKKKEIGGGVALSILMNANRVGHFYCHDYIV